MRRIFKIVWIILTILTALLYLLAAITPFISPVHFGFLNIVSTFYLPITIVYSVFMIAWLLIRKKVFALLLILFFSGYKSFTSTFAFNFKASKEWKKENNTIRVMSWNVNRFGTPYPERDFSNGTRQRMLRYIQKVQPDVLCLQDFRHNEEVTSKKPAFVNNITDVFNAGGFSYVYYPFYYEYDGPNYCDKFGVAIFSKYPITDTGSILNKGYLKAEKSGFVEIIFNEKKLRIYTAHLSSMSLWSNMDENKSGLNYLEDSTKYRAKNIYRKIEYFGKIHATEAENIKSFINKSPVPVLFTADLNSTPSSYVYHHLKENLNDAFLNNAWGVGGTYNRIYPKPRIDVMFFDDELEVTQFTRPAIGMSDHFPLIADIRWKK